MKRFVLAFIAAYIFIFFWGWLLNGVFLKDVYAQTPNLWRAQSEMMIEMVIVEGNRRRDLQACAHRVALFAGEHRLPACSCRQLAGNTFAKAKPA